MHFRYPLTSKRDAIIGDGVQLLVWPSESKYGDSAQVLDLSRYGRNGTATAVTYEEGPDGNPVMRFNGTTSTVAIGGTDPVGTGNITVAAWFRPVGLGETSQGHIFSNTQFGIYLSSIANRLRVTSNSYTTQANFVNAYALNTWRFCVVTRAADGTAVMYINAVRIGSASSGTPVSGNTPQIGNGIGTARTWDGQIGIVFIQSGLATQDQASEWFSQTRHIYGV